MAWEENKHPRDKSGQFTSKGNEGQGGKESNITKDYNELKNNAYSKEEIIDYLKDKGYSENEISSVINSSDDDFDNDYDFESWNNDISDEDVIQEIADNDYYYGGLDEQEIYNLVAKRLNITPERVEQALKNQGFDYQEYQNYIEGVDDFENWEDDSSQKIVSDAQDELGINALDSYENYEKVCDWMMNNGFAKDFSDADKIIKNSFNTEEWKKFNKIYDEWAGLEDLEEFEETTNQLTPKQWLDKMKSQSMEGMPDNLKKSLNAWIQNEYEKMKKEESKSKK